MSVSSYLDEYDEVDENFDYIYNEGTYESSYSNVWYDCVLPSLASIQTVILKLLVVNFVFGLLVSTRKIPEVVLHILCALIGLYFVSTLEHNTGKVLFLIFVIMSYVFVQLKNVIDQHKKFKYFNGSNIVKCGTVITLVLCQYFLLELHTWMEIRGVVMVFTMKLISLLDDIDKNPINNPSMIQYFGYMCCGSNVMFGPWISYAEYLLLFRTPTIKSKWWLFGIMRATMTSLMYLIISNCIISFLIPDDSNRWLIAYKEAVSFRMSHYFISFLSESTMLAAGYKNSRIWNNPDKWNYVVAVPLQIEFPTALATVIINWNKPMHDFLKKYVYRSYIRHGKFWAILATFVVSSLLHGFELKVSVVLITIGIFSYVQYSLRNYLSEAFNFCIKIYTCRDICQHNFKRSYISCVLVNFLFSLLSILHLVFLGMLMDPTTDEVGIIKKWKDLYFISFWIILMKILIII